MDSLIATIVVEYEVPDDHKDRLAAYDSADLFEMAKVDEITLREDPPAFLGNGGHLLRATVEPNSGQGEGDDAAELDFLRRECGELQRRVAVCEARKRTERADASMTIMALEHEIRQLRAESAGA